MPQNPGTTILNIVQAARDLRLGESLYPEEVARAASTTGRALTDDGLIAREALRSLDWSRVDWYLPTASVGSNVAEEYVLPQRARVQSIVLRTKTAPAGSEFRATVMATGWGSGEIVSIPIGQISTGTAVRRDVSAGGILRLNVSSDGGATGVTVSVFYSPLEGGA